VDDLVAAKLRPVIEDLDCSVAKNLGSTTRITSLRASATGRPGRLSKNDTQLHRHVGDANLDRFERWLWGTP